MSEYYYSKSYKKWFNVMRVPDGFYKRAVKDCELDPSLVSDLRNARKNGRFLIISNKNREMYGGIDCDFIYMPIRNLKLVLTHTDHSGMKTQYAYCVYTDRYSSGRIHVPIKYILNWNKIIKRFTPDFAFVVDYVEDVSYMMHYNTTHEERMRVREQNYNNLDDDAKLFYQVEGKYSFR